MADDFVTTKIIGLDQLEENLKALDEKLQKKALRRAIKAGCNVWYLLLVALAPKDTGFMSHHFGTKIRLYRDVDAASGFVGPQGKIDYPNDAAGHYKISRSSKGRVRKIGRIAVASVVRFFEFGTSKMGKKPFMTQAGESGKQGVIDAVINSLREDLL